jgi:hypothetical protein
MKTFLRAALCGLAVIPCALISAQAADLPIQVGGSLDGKVQAEAIKSTDHSTKGNIYSDADFQAYLNWSDWLSFNTDVKLERQRNDNINDYFPKSNAAFRSEGVTLRQLYATVRPDDAVAIYGGKIHPRFGSAWRATPGIFYSFASDYEQDERIGTGVELRLPEWTGDTRLSAETFFLDTSVLSNSLFSRPGFDDATADRRRKFWREDGGPSNTGGFDSYTVALQGKRLPVLDGLSYQVSVTSEGVSLPGEKRETGFSAGAAYEVGLTRRITMTPFLEYTSFDNFGGQEDVTRRYYMGGLAFVYGKWELDLAGGYRRGTGAEDLHSSQANITASYEVMEGLRLAVGYNHVRLGETDDNGDPSYSTSNALAVSALYGFKF